MKPETANTAMHATRDFEPLEWDRAGIRRRPLRRRADLAPEGREQPSDDAAALQPECVGAAAIDALHTMTTADPERDRSIGREPIPQIPDDTCRTRLARRAAASAAFHLWCRGATR
jgi:hypothetical protein